MPPPWILSFRQLRKFLDQHDPQRRFRFPPELDARFQQLKSQFQSQFIQHVLGSELAQIHPWIQAFSWELDAVKQALKLDGILLSREFSSFFRDHGFHLQKKLFSYSYDLLRRRISLSSFSRSGSAALITCLRTNLRSLYQLWGFLAILESLALNYGARMIYPEHGYLSLERAGKQRSRQIPPNLILELDSGIVSFFLEVPRPLGWGDSRELRSVWNLYTALRPDLAIYSGKRMDISRPDQHPPILAPELIIEFKELQDWYLRTREIKGQLARPLSAEEWRARWLSGLWEGLADVLGVKPKQAQQLPELSSRVKLSELQVVLLYNRIYRPHRMILISRTELPDQMAAQLSAQGIQLIQGVEFDSGRLKRAVEAIAEIASGSSSGFKLELDRDTGSDLTKLCSELSCDLGSLIKALLKLARANRDQLKQLLDRCLN